MSNLDLQTLRAVNTLGVRFYVPLPSHYGEREYFASPDELLILERNAEDFYAKVHGLTVEQYQDWAGSEWSVVCSATTKAGRRCSNFVKGGYQVSAKEWLERQGETCASHGNLSSRK